MGAVAALVGDTQSERVRLKALIIARRMLYEVGSAGAMDGTALQVRGQGSRGWGTCENVLQYLRICEH